jgi:hypothetical protein
MDALQELPQILCWQLLTSGSFSIFHLTFMILSFAGRCESVFAKMTTLKTKIRFIPMQANPIGTASTTKWQMKNVK